MTPATPPCVTIFSADGFASVEEMRHTQRLIMTYARTCSTFMRSTLLAPALALAACSEDGPAGQGDPTSALPIAGRGAR